jgi:predicted transcriptional regulator
MSTSFTGEKTVPACCRISPDAKYALKMLARQRRVYPGTLMTDAVYQFLSREFGVSNANPIAAAFERAAIKAKAALADGVLTATEQTDIACDGSEGLYLTHHQDKLRNQGVA